MLAATFLRMIPASIALSTSAPVLILAGYFLVQFFEHTLAPTSISARRATTR
jgi:hypothetical protein